MAMCEIGCIYAWHLVMEMASLSFRGRGSSAIRLWLSFGSMPKLVIRSCVHDVCHRACSLATCNMTTANHPLACDNSCISNILEAKAQKSSDDLIKGSWLTNILEAKNCSMIDLIKPAMCSCPTKHFAGHQPWLPLMQNDAVTVSHGVHI